jgi:hypothetical protein
MAQFKFGNHTNGRDSYVSEHRLAQYTALSVSTVRRSRRSLRDGGWLHERDRGHDTGGRKTSSTYWVTIPPHRPTREKLAKRRPNNPRGRNQRSPVTSHQRSNEPQTASSPEVTGDHLSIDTNTEVLSTSGYVDGDRTSGAELGSPGGDGEGIEKPGPAAPGTPGEEQALLSHANDWQECSACHCMPPGEMHAATCPIRQDPWGGEYCPHCRGKFLAVDHVSHTRACRAKLQGEPL